MGPNPNSRGHTTKRGLRVPPNPNSRGHTSEKNGLARRAHFAGNNLCNLSVTTSFDTLTGGIWMWCSWMPSKETLKRRTASIRCLLARRKGLWSVVSSFTPVRGQVRALGVILSDSEG